MFKGTISNNIDLQRTADIKSIKEALEVFGFKGTVKNNGGVAYNGNVIGKYEAKLNPEFDLARLEDALGETINEKERDGRGR